MMTLIAMAISAAYFFSAAVTFGFPGEEFYWELVTLIAIMLLGHWIEMRSVMGASRALEELVRLLAGQCDPDRRRRQQPKRWRSPTFNRATGLVRPAPRFR